MKAKIGKYIYYIGPYQISDWLENFCILERDRDKIGDWLSKTWVEKFCQWIYSKRSRKISVKVDDWDVWGADQTMAILILPILKRLRSVKHGSGHVSDDDVPEELRSTSASPKENDWDTDDNLHKRYDWMMNEVIWALEQIQNDDYKADFYTGNIDLNIVEGKMVEGPNHTYKFDKDRYLARRDRIDNGLRLMGTYWRTFWD